MYSHAVSDHIVKDFETGLLLYLLADAMIYNSCDEATAAAALLRSDGRR